MSVLNINVNELDKGHHQQLWNPKISLKWSLKVLVAPLCNTFLRVLTVYRQIFSIKIRTKTEYFRTPPFEPFATFLSSIRQYWFTLFFFHTFPRRVSYTDTLRFRRLWKEFTRWCKRNCISRVGSSCCEHNITNLAQRFYPYLCTVPWHTAVALNWSDNNNVQAFFTLCTFKFSEPWNFQNKRTTAASSRICVDRTLFSAVYGSHWFKILIIIK